MAIDGQSCKICCAGTLEELCEFRFLPRVTSDCLPFRDGGRLLVCRQCGAAQSPADEQWFEEIREIYNGYSAYHQSGGIEQSVLDPGSGIFRQRSHVLLNKLMALPGVPQSGKVLDVGCGTGGTLRAFSKLGGWRLCGLELDTRNLGLLTSMPGFDKLYTCALADLPDDFVLVTMIHALEHFPQPLAVMQDLRSKIAPGGRLFVEVPNAEANPFDYLIADHMLHFSPATLAALAAGGGFSLDCLATNWVGKELSMTAHPYAIPTPVSEVEPAAKVVDRIHAQIDWLRRFVDAARQAAADSASFGLFGSSIAATWLCGVLGDAVSFFVEEDSNRVGKTHMGRPILSPAQVAPGSGVFLALVPQIALQLWERLSDTTFDLRLPPAIPTAD